MKLQPGMKFKDGPSEEYTLVSRNDSLNGPYWAVDGAPYEYVYEVYVLNSCRIEGRDYNCSRGLLLGTDPSKLGPALGAHVSLPPHLGINLGVSSSLDSVKATELKCECGAHSVGVKKHADWCDMCHIEN